MRATAGSGGERQNRRRPPPARAEEQALSEQTFGRAAPLAALRRALAATAAGAGGCVVVEGQAGAGRTHLLRAAVRTAGEHGLAVAAREAFELDLAAPLVTLAGALRACTDRRPELDWLFDGARRDDSFRTLDRLRTTLAESATRRPLLIVVDDAQWMDDLSALAVRELVPALATAPVLWLFAGRPEAPGTPGLRTLSRLAAAHGLRIRLDALDDTAVAGLCASALGAAADDTVLALAASCGGNPLRITRLMRSLRAGGQLTLAGGRATVAGDELPAGFVDTVRAALDGLGDDTRWLVQACSVLDRPFSLATAARLTGRPETALLPLVAEGLREFLRDDGDGLSYAHDPVRRAIRGALPRTVREQLHRTAAAITHDEGRADEDRAHEQAPTTGPGARPGVPGQDRGERAPRAGERAAGQDDKVGGGVAGAPAAGQDQGGAAARPANRAQGLAPHRHPRIWLGSAQTAGDRFDAAETLRRGRRNAGGALQLGSRRGPGATPAEPAPLAGLSEAERRVALLVADGLTNLQVAEQLFLSPHTVDSHLRKIFTKLDIRRRVDLAARVARERRPP